MSDNSKSNRNWDEDYPEQLQVAQQNENELELLGEELRVVWGEMETLMSTMNPFNSLPASPTPTLVSSSSSSPAPDNEPLEELAQARQEKILQQAPMKTNGTKPKKTKNRISKIRRTHPDGRPMFRSVLDFWYKPKPVSHPPTKREARMKTNGTKAKKTKTRISKIRRTHPDGRPMFRSVLDFWYKPKPVSHPPTKRELKEKIDREKDALIREMHSRVLTKEDELVLAKEKYMSCKQYNTQLEKNLDDLEEDYYNVKFLVYVAAMIFPVIFFLIGMKIAIYLFVLWLTEFLDLFLENPDTPEPHDPQDTLDF